MDVRKVTSAAGTNDQLLYSISSSLDQGNMFTKAGEVQVG